MSRSLLYALAASTTLAGGASMFFGQGTYVNLQPTTPGTQQVGNANISGRVIANSIQAESSAPTAQVIVGNATSTTGANFGGFFRSDSVLGRALYGRASALSGTTHGVWGQSDSPGGRGVTGVAPATTGNATGVWGQTASTTGRGVYGFTTSGIGVNYGVMGQSSSPQGFGVFSQGNLHATGVISGNGSGLTDVNATLLGGLSSAAFLQSIPFPLTLSGWSQTHAIKGETESHYGGSTGIVGIASSYSAVFGPTYGVYGQSNGPSENAAGVYGVSANSTGITYGGRFDSVSTSGRAVSGYAGAASGPTYGVLGQSVSASGWGIFANGRIGASIKAFRIDHPFDPENKYLLHYASESPMPQNFYVGNVVTDAQGYAWVTLPNYFSEINTNFKYQLTVVDGPNSGESDFVQVKIRQEIRDNRFQIRSSSPGVKVSWRVDADRNDLYVRNRPPKDVVAKEGVEKGRYQHPELYGFGPERGMEPDRERERTNMPPLNSK